MRVICLVVKIDSLKICRTYHIYTHWVRIEKLHMQNVNCEKWSQQGKRTNEQQINAAHWKKKPNKAQPYLVVRCCFLYFPLSVFFGYFVWGMQQMYAMTVACCQWLNHRQLCAKNHFFTKCTQLHSNPNTV